MEIKNEMFSNTNQSTKKNEFTFHTFQMQQQGGLETGINVKLNGQKVIPTDLQSIQSPIFNIHFHVPACEGKNIKIYLPKIQPVIHLHFDELARKLEINREQNQEVTFRAFQKLLSMTSSRVGDVKFYSQGEQKETINKKKEFHYQHKLNETVGRNKDLDRTTPFFSLDYTNGTGECASENSKRLESGILGNCGMPDCCGSKNSIKDNENAPEDYLNECDSNSEETLKQKFNLKEAVVVLEDVCETEYFKNMVAAGYIRDGTLDRNIEDDLLDRLEDTEEEENMSVSSQESGSCCDQYENENELFSPESGSPSKSREIGGNINPLNPSNQMLFRLAPSSSSSKAILTRRSSSARLTDSSERTISSLAKGCNFSDILTRFKMKKCNDPEKYSEDIANPGEARSNERFNYESDETILESSSNNQSITTRASFHTRQSINRNPSQNCRDQPDLEGCREDSKNLNEPNGNPNDHNDTDPEDTALESPSNKLGLDAWTSEEAASNSRLEMISVISPSWQKRILTFPETRESNRLANLSVSGFRLDVYEEEMGRSNNKETGKNFKKKATEVESLTPKETSPSKKMKQSDESKKSGTEEYIPLQSTGATKFAVAPLNKMNSYKTHEARNFKADMLYGKRINRFSSSDQLRIYQLKQEAVKTQAN